MSIFEHTLQGSLNLDSFYFYKTDFSSLDSVVLMYILRTPQKHYHAQFASSRENPKVGFAHFSVEVQQTLV